MNVGFLGVLELLCQPVYLKNEGIQRSEIVNVCLVMLKRIRVEQHNALWFSVMLL